MARSSVKRVARKVAAKTAPKAPGKGHNKPPKDGGKGRDATTEQLAIARELGWRVAGQDLGNEALLNRLRTVKDQKAVKYEYWTAYIAKCRNPKAVRYSAAMLADALRIRKTPVAERNVKEANAYNAATTSWSRQLKKLEVKTTEKRGGANGGGKRGANERDTSTPAKSVAASTLIAEAAKAAPPIPTVKKASEVGAYLMMRAAQDLAFINRNRSTVEDERIAKIVESFHDSLKAVLDEKPAKAAA